MDDNYYSLDQLLAENQKVPCVFNVTVPGMGYLEGTHERDVNKCPPIQKPTQPADSSSYLV
jgi:GINS complex subunit 3